MIRVFQGLIKAFYKQFLQAFLNLLVNQLNVTVLQIIQDVGNNTDWTDVKKREEAFNRIKLISIQSGKNLADSAISKAIEIGLDILKNRTI